MNRPGLSLQIDCGLQLTIIFTIDSSMNVLFD